MNETYIQCGISIDRKNQEEGQNKFWPVLDAIPLPFVWAPVLNQKYSLVFTSKIAVKLFSQRSLENFSQVAPRKGLEHICAVGNSTAKLIEKEILVALSAEKNSPILYPKQEGLFNLLTQISFAESSLVYIFTAENGKTLNTLKLLHEKELKFSYLIVPVYRLESFQSNFLSQLFLRPQLNQSNQQEQKFIFCCRSGEVLKTAVLQLQSFFSCTAPCDLPSFIYFAVEKPSTKNELQALGLIDRIAS